MPIKGVIQINGEDKTLAQISITVSETAHWHALISRAEFHAHQLLPHGVEDYLVRLFMRYEQEDQSVFQIKKKQDDNNNLEVEQKLQRLGDQCLLLCGFYPEASEEYGVALDEFCSMGSEAYQKLATLDKDESAIIFEYLSNNFKQMSEMLCYISGATAAPNDKHQCKKIDAYEDALSASFNRIEQTPFSSPISNRVLN